MGGSGDDDQVLISWLAILGVCLLVGGFVLGVGAIRFEFAYVGETATPETADWAFQYTDLTAEDKAIVDRAIAGTPYVAENYGTLPGPGKGDIAIQRDGTWHYFTRDTTFVAETPSGIAAIATALLGVASIALAIRRTVAD